MNDNFEYKCRRRSGVRCTSPSSEENFGAGSGGEWYNGSHDHYYDGWYQLSSPGIELVAEGETFDESPNLISLRAISPDSVFSGAADLQLHSDGSMRITTGPPEISKDLQESPREGVRVETGNDQILGLYHGPSTSRGSSLEFTDSGVTLNAEEDNGIIISSKNGVTLISGTSCIQLTPAGIIIDGPMVWINSDPPPTVHYGWE